MGSSQWYGPSSDLPSDDEPLMLPSQNKGENMISNNYGPGNDTPDYNSLANLLNGIKEPITSSPNPNAPNFMGPPSNPQGAQQDLVDQLNQPMQTPDRNPASGAAALLAKYKSLSVPSNASGQPIGDAISKLLNGNNDQMQAAMQMRNADQATAGYGKAANMVLGGMMHTNPSNEVYNDIERNAGQGIGDINTMNQQRMDKLKEADLSNKLGDELQKSKPDSDISGFYREVAKKYGFNIPDTTSASTLEKILPNIEKWAQNEETRKSNALYRQALLSNKTSLQDTKNLVGAQKALMTDKVYQAARSGSDAADEADILLDSIKNDPGNAKIASQAMSVVAARMATHGTRINQTEIHNVSGDPSWAGAMQRIISRSATGVMSDNDYNQFKKLISLYKASASKAMAEHELSAAQQFSQINHDTPENNITKLTGKPSAAPQMNQSDPRIDAFMNANGITDREEAIKILKENGKL